MEAWVWILLLVIVAAVVVAVVMSRSRQRENRRVEAAELRDPTADHHLELREKEAAAAASEAEARRVRAEADQRAAEAQRLEVEAQRAGMDRDSAAATQRRRSCGAPTPWTRTWRTDKEGYRLDEAGNRIENTAEERSASGLGAPAAAGAGGLAAGAGAAAFASSRDDHDHESQHATTVTGTSVGGRVGNMRGLRRRRRTVPADPDRGRSDEARAEQGGRGAGRQHARPRRRRDSACPATRTVVGPTRRAPSRASRWSGSATCAASTTTTRQAVPGDPDRGRSDEARAEQGEPVERVGNMRGLDDRRDAEPTAVRRATARWTTTGLDRTRDRRDGRRRPHGRRRRDGPRSGVRWSGLVSGSTRCWGGATPTPTPTPTRSVVSPSRPRGTT